MIEEVIYASILLLWVIVLVKVLTKRIYDRYVNKGAD
ncbi:MAG TPA: dolichol kinase, partial [Candidatus Bathyarchaeota archaeon]|nr:dolichol kinase [Candidatus Bathyarchaeota archaeon]